MPKLRSLGGIRLSVDRAKFLQLEDYEVEELPHTDANPINSFSMIKQAKLRVFFPFSAGRFRGEQLTQMTYMRRINSGRVEVVLPLCITLKRAFYC